MGLGGLFFCLFRKNLRQDSCTGNAGCRALWIGTVAPLAWGEGVLALLAEHPLLWGIWPPAFPTFLAGRGFVLRHSPPSSPGGDLASGIPLPPRRRGIWPPAFPTPLPRGPLQQLEKSSQSAIWRPVFFCTPSIPYASKLATVCPGTKKALKRCLRAFFRCCGERGIRTPGTVTRTSV